MSDPVGFFVNQEKWGMFLPRLVAEASYRSRKRRREHLGSAFCADYGTDLLLIMYLAHDGQAGLSATSTSRELGVPQSVIQRWIDLLVDRKLASPVKVTNGEDLFAITERGRFVIDDSCGLLRLA